MNRPAALLGLILVLTPAPCAADMLPTVAFVHALQAKGYPDLVVDYAERALPTSVHAQRLELELAVLIARRELLVADRVGEERRKGFAAAAAGFNKFLEQYPKAPLAGLARLEYARCILLEARPALVPGGERLTLKRLREMEAADRRTRDGEQELQIALTLLDTSIISLKLPPEPATPLIAGRDEARLLLCQTALDRAAYLRSVERREDARTLRAQTVAELQKLGDAVTTAHVRWTARAEVVRGLLDMNRVDEARWVVAEILKSREPVPEAARERARALQVEIDARQGN